MTIEQIFTLLEPHMQALTQFSKGKNPLINFKDDRNFAMLLQIYCRLLKSKAVPEYNSLALAQTDPIYHHLWILNQFLLAENHIYTDAHLQKAISVEKSLTSILGQISSLETAQIFQIYMLSLTPYNKKIDLKNALRKIIENELALARTDEEGALIYDVNSFIGFENFTEFDFVEFSTNIKTSQLMYKKAVRDLMDIGEYKMALEIFYKFNKRQLLAFDNSKSVNQFSVLIENMEKEHNSKALNEKEWIELTNKPQFLVLKNYVQFELILRADICNEEEAEKTLKTLLDEIAKSPAESKLEVLFEFYCFLEIFP